MEKDGRLTFRRVGVTDPRGVRSSIPRCKTCWRLKKDKRVLAKEALKALLNRIGNLGNPLISTIMLQVFSGILVPACPLASDCSAAVHVPILPLQFLTYQFLLARHSCRHLTFSSDLSHIYAFKSLFVRRYVVQRQL